MIDIREIIQTLRDEDPETRENLAKRLDEMLEAMQKEERDPFTDALNSAMGQIFNNIK